MCDFRKITKIKLGGRIIDCSPAPVIGYDGKRQDGEPLTSGLYLIRATGAFHGYFDGKRWFYERELAELRGEREWWETAEWEPCSGNEI